ncbi:MAG TPA: alpha/beta hydrolase [Mucilaginibacter sp.]|jgi:pimeloyl-ACP methyl ester carboxylesterase
MSKAYLIAGLGADPRIYKHIVLEGYEVVKVEWLTPNESDTLESYAQRLIDQYAIGNNSIIVGNSLGGMLAIEIAKKVPLEKVILISSIKTIDEAPAYFKLFRDIPVYNVIPGKVLSVVDFIMELVYGEMNKADIELFQDMLKTWTPEFLRWAMGAALHWENKIIPPNTYHIVGDKDKVFPSKKIKDAIVVKGGTHIMIYDEPGKINKILKSILENETSPVVLS